MADRLRTIPEYSYGSSEQLCSSRYLGPIVRNILLREAPPPKEIFEVGCGNGSTANMLSGMGYKVTGIDTSSSGIKIARETYPQIHFERASAYDDLASRYGSFPVVISLEVIEHLYDPRAFLRGVQGLMTKRGLGIFSTPYHGYLKNIAVVLTGHFDKHFNPLWDGGHIKFWSESTLTQLLCEAGFEQIHFFRAGRLPPFAKSMIVVFREASS